MHKNMEHKHALFSLRIWILQFWKWWPFTSLMRLDFASKTLWMLYLRKACCRLFYVPPCRLAV